MDTTTGRLRKNRWGRHPHAVAFSLFAVVIGVLYWPVLDGARSLVTNGRVQRPFFVIDTLGGGPIQAPLTRLAAASWGHLQLPIVDPFQGFGIPLVSNQGVPVYPPQVIAHLLFPGNYSTWFVINLVALAFGVYLLARAFGVSFSGGMAAGFLAALAGPVPPNINTSVPNPLAVLPFVLVAVRYAVDPGSSHRRTAMLGIATSVALLCLSGFQELLPLMAVVIVVYTAALVVHYQTWRSRPRRIAGVAAAGFAGAAIGSIGILPTLAVVNAGASVNGPSSYLSHSPVFWLSTLVFPTLTGRAMNESPQGLGHPVNAIGTPLLVLVVVLALLAALRAEGRATRWYVLPSVAFVLFGVLAYADVAHVLQLLHVPVFEEIGSNRFLQFAWWVPLCLLVGTVVSNAGVLRWTDVLSALAAAVGVGAYTYWRYRQALAASHVPGGPSVGHAPIVAATVVVCFVAAIVAGRWTGARFAGGLMAAVVLASCVYALPTNFAPAADGRAVAAVKVPGDRSASGDQLAFFGIRQLPTRQYSVQLWGPVIPEAYRVALTGLFNYPETGGLGALWVVAPTLGVVTLTPRTVSVLGSMGVDLLLLTRPLSGSGFSSIPSCAKASTSSPHLVCFVGGEPDRPQEARGSPKNVYAYRVVGADPLVQPTAVPVPVASTAAALQKVSHELSPALLRFPSKAFVTTGAAHLRAARGVRGIDRRATAEHVWITLHTVTAGLAVLRESYEPGMHAVVDGRAVPASPVDGGLWTAVTVPSGTSHVVLDYATTAEVVEFAGGAAGLLLLTGLWMALAVSRGRRARVRGRSSGAEPMPRPAVRERVGG